MPVALEWAEPAEAVQWQWEAQGRPMSLRFMRLSMKWSLLLGLPSIAAVAWFAPTELTRLGIGIVGVLAFISAQFVITTWIGYKLKMHCGVRYSVDGSGIRIRGIDYTGFCHWKHIQCYRVVKHTHLMGISVLELQMKPSQRSQGPISLMAQLMAQDEERLRAALHSHLPECSSEASVIRVGLPAL